MMHVWSSDRRRFVDFLTNQHSFRGDDVRKVDTIEGVNLGGDDVLLVWQGSPANTFSLPHVAVVAEGSLSDFLAWVMTYFRQFRPFTAHCRVLTPSLAKLSAQSTMSNVLPEIGSADIGLILAEGIAYSAGRTDLNRLPLSAYSRTLSYAFAEGARLYDQSSLENRQAFDQIKSGWTSVRNISNMSQLMLSPADIHDVWSMVLCSTQKSCSSNVNVPEPLILKALNGVRINGQISTEIWTMLSKCIQNPKSLIEALDGPREGRVKAVDIALRELAHGPDSTRRHRAFIAGYITSRIQPGTLDHFPVLSSVAADLRESYLWYGACSGLAPETAVNNYGNGLGWLMKRELERPSHWLDRPDCDIALSEMDLLLRNREGTKVGIHTLANGFLKVEIFPLISTSVKWTEHGESYISERNAMTDHQRSLFGEDSQLLRQDILEVLRKIEESSMSLNAIRKQVEIKFGEKYSKGRNRQK